MVHNQPQQNNFFLHIGVATAAASDDCCTGDWRHVITGSKGPVKIFSSGQLSYWKDGRDVPDIMTGILQYPETTEHPAFQLTLQVNFVSGTGGQESIKLVGEEGVMELKGSNVSVHHSIMAVI